MPTVLSHAIAGAALAAALRPPGRWGRVALLAALCAMAPDADVIAFGAGLPWGHVLGHRGITRSLAFAAALAAAVTWLAFRGSGWRGRRGLGERGLRVLPSELVWVWLPSARVVAAALVVRATGRHRR